MQIWKDTQTGKFFNLNIQTGIQCPSNRYGKKQKKFIPYGGGYSHNISPRNFPVDPQIAIQPHRFDGYCQFPRPFEKSSFSKPYKTSSNSPSIPKFRHPEDKIPNPLHYLKVKTQVPSFLKPLKKNKITHDSSAKDLSICSIDDLKKLEVARAVSIVRTKTDLETRLKKELQEFKAAGLKPKKIQSRRKLKGFFKTDFKNCQELIEHEKLIIEKTNPVFVEVKNKYKDLEFKKIARKRKAIRLLLATNY